MTPKKVTLAVSLLLVFVTFSPAQSQKEDKSKRPSPPGTAEVTLKGKTVTVDYSRPSMKGRKIMGGLVPYGEVWRTGANEATTLITAVDLNIGGTKVTAGKYTLWTLPSAGTWKLIINKQTGQWGTNYDEKQDFARIDMQKKELSAPVEQFTISFDKKGEDTADLVMQWEQTSVSVPIKAE
jgi:hypothetical protein